MTDPRTCPHEHTEPVYAYLHGPDPEVGDSAWVANDGRPVARICVDCYEQLPTGWGCDDCGWVEERRLCDLVPMLVLARPCPEHAVDGVWSERAVVPDGPPPAAAVMRLLLVPTIDDLAAPTMAELDAGTDLTPYLVQPEPPGSPS